ncbi:MAG: hypothetical protein ACRCUT_05135 [Spirochaetota bacterium]
MIISLDKLINLKGNKYLMTKATLLAVDRIGNIKGYPDDDAHGWKVVPCVLDMVLNEKIKFLRTAAQPKEIQENTED